MKLDRVKLFNNKPYIIINGKYGQERQFGKIIICKFCGQKTFAPSFRIKNGSAKFCSPQCSGKAFAGDKSPIWKGGKGIRSNGYIEITIPKNHPLRLKG